jgi:hypothetical protein
MDPPLGSALAEDLIPSPFPVARFHDLAFVQKAVPLEGCPWPCAEADRGRDPEMRLLLANTRCNVSFSTGRLQGGKLFRW